MKKKYLLVSSQLNFNEKKKIILVVNKKKVEREEVKIKLKKKISLFSS